MSNPDIKFIANRYIDRERWDQCIDQSPNGIAYAYSWYLDRICKRWDALIGGNYEFVLPLVNNRKYGISYIYQPFFTQQLGVFSKHPINQNTINLFLNAIPKKFRLTDMQLNIGNTLPVEKFDIRENTTFHLDLGNEIAKIRANYHSNTRRNIHKAKQNKVSVIQFSDIRLFIEFTLINLKEKSPEIKSQHYLALSRIIDYALFNDFGEIYVAQNFENKLLAAAFFLKTNGKCIYLAASSNDEGIEKSAMFLLIDTFIQNNAGSQLILDFEGSNIPGVARFYAGFGAVPQTYLAIHQNRLPSFLHLLKK